jgi:ribonuclease G
LSIAGRFLVLVPDADFIGVSKKTHDDAQRRKLKRLIAQIKPPGIGFIVRTIGLKVSESEFIKEIHLLLDTWRSVQNKALRGSGTRLLYREMGITTRVIRDLFSENVSMVYADQKEDFDEIMLYLQTLSPDLCKRVVLHKDSVPLFDKFNIEKDLERSLGRKVWLKNGGYILFDHTEALLAIDVNTGRNIGKSDLEETILRTNLVAVEEIGRQLRLRDIGGLIVVDFIDMERTENIRKVESAMRKMLRNDPTATSCTGLSKFCLMEITRKRVRPELQELYTDVCHACNGLGWVFSPATISARIERWLQRSDKEKLPRELTLMVSPSVHAYLKSQDNQIIKRLEQEHTFRLKVVEDENMDQDEYVFMAGKEQKPLMPLCKDV